MSDPERWEESRPHSRLSTIGGLALLVAAALVVGMLLGGEGVAPTPPDLVVEETPPPSPLAVSTPSEAPALLGGEWERIRVGPLAGRSRATAVWTGTEVMVWGGGGFEPYADGALYNPATDRWRRAAPSPLRPRVRAAGVWNGTEAVFLGGSVFVTGRSVTARAQPTRDGAAYNPATRTWRALPPLPFPTQDGRVFASAGRLYVVSNTARPRPLAVLDRGAAFWRTPEGPPGWRRSGEVAATRIGADRLLLWPAGGGDAVTVELPSERWTTVTEADRRPRRADCRCPVVAGVFPDGPVAAVVYDPGRRRWSPFDADALSASAVARAPRFTFLVEGAMRAIFRGEILDLPTTPQGLGRDPAVVWAGDRLFAWGGVRSLRGLFTSDGLTFTPR